MKGIVLLLTATVLAVLAVFTLGTSRDATAQEDKNGKATDEAAMKTCFPCHQAIKERDFIFTRYTP